MIGYILLGVLVVGFVIWLVNRGAFSDLWKSGRAQLGKIGTAAKNADPHALLTQEIKDKEAEVNGSLDALEESKAMVNELESQVKGDQRRVAQLDARIKASLKDDRDDKSGKAGEYAMELATAKANLEKNEAQFKRAQGNHANNLARFRAAQQKVADAKQRARQLGVELKQSATDARLNKMSASFNVNVGDLDEKLSETEAAVRAQIARNNAVGEVQAELGNDVLADIKEEERLRKAEASSALDEYRKQMDLSEKS
jgi:phage shock protein A